MIGSAVLSLPWAFQKAGLVAGVLITMTSSMVCFYSCHLFIKHSKNDVNFTVAFERHFGTFGYYFVSIAIILLFFGGLIAYAILMSQLSYSVLTTIFTDENSITNEVTLARFSPAYTAIFVQTVVFLLSLKNDMSLLIKINSYGAVCLWVLLALIMFTSFQAFANTTFSYSMSQEENYETR